MLVACHLSDGTAEVPSPVSTATPLTFVDQTGEQEGFPMVTTFADLEARARGLESRTQRAEEDITAIMGTVMETRDDVKQLKGDVKQLKGDVKQLNGDVKQLKGDATWLKRAVQALLDHDGISVDDVGEDDV
jgi:peptidoglycan hydrolase CwlO-like protein